MTRYLPPERHRSAGERRRNPAHAHSVATRRQPGSVSLWRRYPLPSKRKTACSIYESIADLDAGDWNAIIGNGALLRSHEYLTAVEQSGVANCRYFYPVLFDTSGKISAHACVYVIDTDLAQLLPKSFRRPVQLLRRFWSRLLVARITECAAPLSTSHSISMRPGSDPRVQLEGLAGAIEEIARRENSRLIVIRDFLTRDKPIYDALLAQNFNLVHNMPLARIRIRWATYEEYLRSMRARYRKDVKRRLKRARDTGQTVVRLDSFGAQADLWAAQARTVQDATTGIKREVLPPAYYANMDRELADRSMLVATVREGRAVAHGMLLLDDHCAVATYFGRDRGPACHEWFHLVNEVIRIGIERGSEYVNLGLGSYDAKLNVGAEVEPLFVYSKSTLAPLNWLMKLVPRAMHRTCPRDKQIFRNSA